MDDETDSQNPLPPYSPDLNPIEKTFGSMKRKWPEQPDLSLDELVKLFY
jgi:transposase